MGRSVKKGPYIDDRLMGRVTRLNDGGRKEPLKTWARRCAIVPEFVGHTFMVHNGRVFLRVYVTEDMVGHKLGEFAPTRLFRAHTIAAAKVEPATPAAE